MTEISLFASLPDMLFTLIFEFANDGPLRLAYHAKKKCFVNKTNPHFSLLNAANQFKIDNPPHWDVDDPNFDFEIGTTELDIIENLTFKYPLKFSRFHKGCHYDGIYSCNGYLQLTYSFSKSFLDYTTKKCTISLPQYYHLLNKSALIYYQQEMDRKLSDKKMFRLRNFIKNFDKMTFANDIEII